MTFEQALRKHLDETGESMRALSLRAGLNPKAVSDILGRPGLRPKRATVDALSRAVGAPLPAPQAAASLTYADLLARLEREKQAGCELAPRRIRRLRWLLRKAGWVAEAELVDRRKVVDFFARHRPATFDLTPGSYSTYKSEVLDLLPRAAAPRPRSVSDIGGMYGEVRAAIRDSDLPKDLKNISGTFLVFLHDEGIAPGDIARDTLQAYFESRLARSGKPEATCIKHVKRIATLLAKLNATPEFARFGFAAPTHPFGNRRDKFGVDAAVIAPLLAEFDRRVVPWARGELSCTGETRAEFLASLDAQTPAPPPEDKKAALRRRRAGAGKPEGRKVRDEDFRRRGFLTRDDQWSDRTVAVRRGYLAAMAKALYAADGFVIESLEELTDPEIAEAAAEALAEANADGEHQSSYVGGVLKVIHRLGRDFVRRDAEDVALLAELVADHDADRDGIAPRNMARLRAFTSDRIQAFIDFSNTLLTGVNAEVDRRRQAHRREKGVLPKRSEVFDADLRREVMTVIAHDVMLARAPRSANLILARLDWISWTGELATLRIPAASVKMRDPDAPDLPVPLDGPSSRLLRLYIDQIRPDALREGDERNPYLFPEQGDRAPGPDKPYRTLLKRLCRRVHEVVGVRINPHLYRHLIGWIWLKEDPDRLPDVQKLLGHRKLQTTLEFYAALDDELSLGRWQEYINERKASHAADGKARVRGSGRRGLGRSRRNAA